VKRGAQAWVRAVSSLVPRAARARWVEEWLAEIDHAAAASAGRRFESVRLLRMASGTVPDIVAIRRVSRAARRVPGPPASRGVMFNGLLQDLRHALRVLIAAPGFSAGVIGSLALGITVNAAAFAMINGMFLRPVSGIGEPGRVVRLSLCRAAHGDCLWETSSYDDYLAMRGSLRTLTDLSARVQAQVAGRIGGEALTLRAGFVSPNYFDVFGTRLPFGRAFAANEVNEPVAVISHIVWTRQFDENPAALGTFVDVGSTSVRIVGVAPPDFLGATAADRGRDIWIPFGLMGVAAAPPRTSPFSSKRPENHHDIQYAGRLAPGASIAAARAEAEVYAAGIPGERRLTARTTRFALRDWTTERMLEAVGVLMPLPLLVLGVACLNAASLLLARATYRVRETMIRLALGATRWRVMRSVFIESLLLALTGAALSVPLTVWLVGGVTPLMPVSSPIDWRVLAFTAAIAAGAAVLVGIAPAVRTSSRRPALGTSRPGDGGVVAPRLRHAIVLAQVAISLGLLATGTQSLSAVSALFATGTESPERVLLASFDLDHLRRTPQQAEEFYRQLHDRVGRMPQVAAAGLAPGNGIWTFGRGMGGAAIIAWGPDDDPKKGSAYLGGYASGQVFDAVGLAVLEGRGFQPEDSTPSRPRVAIVNQPLARKMFGGASAIGRSIHVSATRRHEDGVSVTIVGVLEPALDRSYSQKPVPALYVPAPLGDTPARTLYLRLRTPLADVVPGVRQAVAAIDPRVPVIELSSLREQMERNSDEHVLAVGATILGAVALLLASGGLYGLFSFIVSLRQREIGVRMALGAEPAAVLSLVLRQAMRLAVIGSAIGGFIALVAGAIVRANLFGTPSIDPLMLIGSSGILLVALLAAGYIPARRAARVDPIVVLRQE
jgi:predicted permease